VLEQGRRALAKLYSSNGMAPSDYFSELVCRVHGCWPVQQTASNCKAHMQTDLQALLLCVKIQLHRYGVVIC